MNQKDDETQKRPPIPRTESYKAPSAQSSASRYLHLLKETAHGEKQSTITYPDGYEPKDVPIAFEGSARIAEPSYARKIANALLLNRDLNTAWALFEATYTSRDCKALTQPSIPDIALLKDGTIFLLLLTTVNLAFCRGDTHLPVTPTQLLFRYEQLGIARPEYWVRQTLAYLTYQAIEAANTAAEHRQQILPVLLHELISLWRLFFQCKGINKDELQSISTEWNLSPAKSMTEDTETKNFGLRLQKYLPRFVGNSTLGFCAVYLYSISDALMSAESLKQEATPLLHFFERLLAGSHVDYIYRHTEYSSAWNALSPDVRQQIMQEIDRMPSRALIRLGASGGTLAENKGDEAANLEAFYLKRIARAVESTTSSVNLKTTWTQVQDAFTSEGQKPAIPPLVYNALLSGFMKLHRSSQCVEVWNHMIVHGVQPTSRTWVALLDGCVKAKDLDGMDEMWQRMLHTGLEPDDYLWTVRVNGLISLRQVSRGLMALDEMGKKWLAAEKIATTTKPKMVNKVTKPTIEVVNGALSAIVRIRPDNMSHGKKLEFVQKIIGWAGSFNIRPDARTYNSIIRLYLDANDYSNAFKVLRKMEADGVTVDIATHTMIVSAAFDSASFDSLSASEQTSRMLSHLNSVEASGVKLNDHIYSIALDRMLKQYNNADAARAVIDHLTARKLVPSAAIYTSLASFYFQQEPPNILAVDGLVHQIFTSHRVPSDAILYDRLMEGYAMNGEVGKMMSVLARMTRFGTPTGWQTLTKVVLALFENGDFERARKVVSDIMRVEGVAEGGILGGPQGEKRFFAMLESIGLGAEEMDGRRDSEGPARWRRTQRIDPDDMADSQSVLRDQSQDAVSSVQEQVRQRGDVENEDVHGFLSSEQETAQYRA